MRKHKQKKFGSYKVVKDGAKIDWPPLTEVTSCNTIMKDKTLKNQLEESIDNHDEDHQKGE